MSSSATTLTTMDQDHADLFNNQAIDNLREYLRIPSVHPNVNYDGCITFLEMQAKTLALPINVYYVVPDKPIAIITWLGQVSSLPSILLNSHMDVVPVYKEEWTHDPFSADIDEQNNVYARGAQDMKSVGIQYLEAVRRLKQKGVQLKRTIHISFVPDEEIGGVDGMRKFVNTPQFKNLNIGFALDEGMASETNEFAVFNGERCIWQMHIHCPGHPGHGSLLFENTAGEKVAYLLNKFFQFRKQELNKLRSNSDLTIGDVTTLNVTQLKGGVQSNVVPPEFIVVVDCRIPVTVDTVQWEQVLNQWCKEAGSEVWIEFEQKQPQIPPTKLDTTNPFWIAFKEATDSMNLQLKAQIFPGGTDSRYVRAVGLPAIGFSPINNTPILLHDNDECLSLPIFLKGIDIYCGILTKIGNVEETTG